MPQPCFTSLFQHHCGASFFEFWCQLGPTRIGTLATLRWAQNLINIVQDPQKKHPSNQHPNLKRFWSQLGTILGGFGGPRWSRDGSKSLQQSIFKTIKKMITFWIASRSIFDGFGEPKSLPNGRNRSLHFGAFWGLGGLFGPRWAKMAPRPLQDAPWHRF